LDAISAGVCVLEREMRMARKTEGECPIATKIFIEREAKKRAISKLKMIEYYSKESGTPTSTLKSWVYEQRKKDENLSTDKPLKKKTKPERKNQLVEVAESIVKGEISDDDIRIVDKAIATAIKEETADVRAGTQTASAVRKVQKKKGGKPKPKEIDNFKRLWDECLKFADGLQLFAEGTMMPESEDEASAAIGVLDAGPTIVVQYARLGMDVEGVLKTFNMKGQNNETIERTKRLIQQNDDKNSKKHGG
jgi:hypothetical protein